MHDPASGGAGHGPSHGGGYVPPSAMTFPTLAPEYADIVALVEQRAGLVFPPNRTVIVQSGIRRAMQAAGIRDVAAYTELLMHSAALMDDLYAELTVGETYFFRDGGQLDVIRKTVFPELRKHLSPTNGVRVWSAGCATGEEPYTLAMMLAEEQMAAGAYVIGTDLSRERLRVAQRGRYRTWSMRGVREEVVSRYFNKKRDYYDLSPAIRDMAEFRYLNLDADNYPSPALGVWGMDLILCRNVLIYFEMDTVASIAEKLLATLNDHGWLFLGASDPMLSDLVDCEVVMTASGLAYRRPRAGAVSRPRLKPTEGLPPLPPVVPDLAAWKAQATMVPPASPVPPSRTTAIPPSFEPPLPTFGWTPTAEPTVSEHPAVVQPTSAAAHAHMLAPEPAPMTAAWLRALYESRDYAGVTQHADTVLRTAGDHEGPWICYVRGLANLGRLPEAERACGAALDKHGTSAELWYLQAILLAEAGRHIESSQAARRAIYLDRHLAVAHLALGTALRKTGDIAGARLAFTNTLRALESLPADAVVPASDGETSERIAMAARVHLQLAEEVA